MRTIKTVQSAFKINMGGIILDQALPNNQYDDIDPFLLIHHMKLEHQGGEKQKHVGVGPHPHRGFSPITFVFKGAVHHRDSLGNDSVVSEGGAQWMNSGKGIVHSERPTKEIAENGGTMEIIQFWVNSPAKHKMDPAVYHPFHAQDIPKIFSEDKSIDIGVFSGDFMGVTGPAKGKSELICLTIQFEKGNPMDMHIPKSHNLLYYQLDGKAVLNGEHEINEKQLAVFDNHEESFTFQGSEKGRGVLLAGVPIQEKIVAQGPFVMNNEGELMAAIRDYQMGKMGILIEEFD